MTSPPSPTDATYGAALLDMVDGLARRTPDAYSKAAEAMERLVEAQSLPVSMEFYTSLHSALCYDVSDCPSMAERMYEKAGQSYKGEFDDILPSRRQAKEIVEGLAALGQGRDVSGLSRALGGAIDTIRRREKEAGGPLQHDRPDDYNVLVSSLILVDDFFKAASDPAGGERMTRIMHDASERVGELQTFKASPLLHFTASMYLHLIRTSCERSVARLQLRAEAKAGMIGSGRRELWPPQRMAIESGLLDGNSLVCSTPAGSGKSLLAYLSLGRANGNNGGTAAYLVPTKSLSWQVGREAGEVLGNNFTIAVSNRDASDRDDDLGECDLVVATYEKMDALLRRGKIAQDDIHTVIVDEVHTIGEREQGVDLEMLLTRLRHQDGPARRQIVALSALVSHEDVKSLAKWLGATPVSSQWRPVAVDEAICLDGMLHLRDGDMRKLPVFAPRRTSKTDEKRLHAAFAFARRAVVDNAPVLVSVHMKSDAGEVARDIKEMLEQAVHLDPDLADALQRVGAGGSEAARAMERTDAVLPPDAATLASLLRSGVAYHHAGLPGRYRSIVEGAARNGKIAVVVATTSTLDQGVNMPFQTVVFYNPSSRVPDGTAYLDAAKYRNAAGRAGRRGLSRTGMSVLVATSQDDLEDIRERLWRPDVERLHSTLEKVAEDTEDDDGVERDKFRWHLLGMAAESGGATFDALVDRVSSSWFHAASPADEGAKMRLNESIRGEMDRLVGMGLAERSAADESYTVTPRGADANASMLLPRSFAFIEGCLGGIDLGSLGGGDGGGDDLDAALLIMAASPAEIAQRHYRTARATAVPAGLRQLRPLFKEIEGYSELAFDRAARIATVLHRWINSEPLALIMYRCGIAGSDAASIEDGMAVDAAWVLSTMARLAAANESVDRDIVDRMNRLAEYSRRGTSDGTVEGLLEHDVQGLRREASIELARYLKSKGKTLGDVSGDEVTRMFSENPEGARALRDGLEERGLIRGVS